MTRSTRSVQTYKEAKKEFKQKAVDAGHVYKPEIYSLWNQNVADAERDKVRAPPLHSARNPRRMDGAKWNGSTFVCPGRVEEDGDIYVPEFILDEHEYEYYSEGKDHRMEVNLMDFARPAKPRGVRKEFEVVEKLPRVIALEDDEDFWESYDDWYLPEEDWADVFVEGPSVKKSFAEVLRDGG